MLQPPKKTELSTCWKALQSCSKGVNFTLQQTTQCGVSDLKVRGCNSKRTEIPKRFSAIFAEYLAVCLHLCQKFCVISENDAEFFASWTAWPLFLHSFAIYACTLATRLFSSLVWYWALLLKACYWPRIENFLQEPLVRFCLFLSRSARIAFRHWFFWQSIYVIFCLLSIKRKQKFQHPAWSLLGIRCLHLLTPCFLGCILQRNC